MERIKEKVCAVVVTYNRKELLQECLDALLEQTYHLDSIIIINNASTDGTEDLLKKKYLSNSVFDYLNTCENLGGAGGFYEGMKRAYDNGFDWIWLMDDDAIPYNNALTKLISSTHFNKKTACLFTQVIGKDGNIQLGHRRNIKIVNNNIITVDSSNKDYTNKSFKINNGSFVGPLINTRLSKEIGLPMKDFFIWNDDLEFFLRLNNVGNMYCISDSIILHKDSNDTLFESKKLFFGKSFKSYLLNKLWKIYLGKRNYLYIQLKYTKVSKYRILYDFCSDLLVILLFNNNKWIRWKLTVNAYSDAVNGIFNNKKYLSK